MCPLRPAWGSCSAGAGALGVLFPAVSSLQPDGALPQHCPLATPAHSAQVAFPQSSSRPAPPSAAPLSPSHPRAPVPAVHPHVPLLIRTRAPRPPPRPRPALCPSPTAPAAPSQGPRPPLRPPHPASPHQPICLPASWHSRSSGCSAPSGRARSWDVLSAAVSSSPSGESWRPGITQKRGGYGLLA